MVMWMIENMRKEISDCECVGKKEVCISNAKDKIEILSAKVDTLESRGKVLDSESRSQNLFN